FRTDPGRFEKETHWAAEHWKGRVVRFTRLPSKMDEAEVQAVAKVILPEGDRAAIRMLAASAEASPSYLQAIRAGASRARYFAAKEGVPVTAAHVLRATGERLAVDENLTAGSAVRRPSGAADRSKVSAIPVAATEAPASPRMI